MNKDAILKQLMSLRASIDSLASGVDAALSILVDEFDKCEHKNRLNLTTMGGPEYWQCKDCGFQYSGEE